MNRHILIENMLRFGTRNLSLAAKRNLIAEAAQPVWADQVTYKGKKHAVIASAWDDSSSIVATDSFISQKIREAGATADNWVLLQTAANTTADPAYEDISAAQLKMRWSEGIWMFVSGDNVTVDGSAGVQMAAGSERDTEDSWFTAGIRGGIITRFVDGDAPYKIDIRWNGKRINGIHDDKTTQTMIAQIIGGDQLVARYVTERPMEPEQFADFLDCDNMREVAEKLAKAIGAQFKTETVNAY